MRTMRIYIADHTDNLRTAALKNKVGVDDLIFLNPHITDPLSNIAGQQVKLPPLEALPDKLPYVPPCTFQLINPKAREQWIPLTSLDDMLHKEYDVLIVGTGAGGGAVLWRLMQQLANSGKRIGVLERGGLLIPTHAQNIETMNQRRVFDYYASTAHFIGNYLSGQTYALGGRTLFWSTTSPRMPISEILRWPVSLPEMEQYYALAENALSVTQNFTKGAPLMQVLLNRLQRNGYPDAAPEPLAVNLEPPNKFGVMNSNPFFSSIHFLAQALNRPYDLAIHARAVKVLTEKNSCVGIEVISSDNKKYVLNAKNVVLSAGTFGSAQILLNSDIYGRAVGHYMTNHSRMIGFGRVNRNEFPEVLGPLRILLPGQVGRSYQIQIVGPGDYAWVQYAEQPLQENWNLVLGALGQVESRYDNYVSLDPAKRDEDGVPELNIHFSYSERDEEVIRQMDEGVKKAAAAMNISLVSDIGPAVCRLPTGSDIHEMGTCRMGEDPLTSATNRFGQIHGVNGLYVADNSVIPTSGTANPTLTTVALAFRTADEIARHLK
ncbi:GMC oxidoreductase [Paenibacillus wynnii]|uniref:GMC oxidoreductase n=1 Tax=Paenibacillus wynnii TaxID=268407 RepID=UPI00278EA951|nr:GMC family oxidoreductase [Paenibacillus wynnii]MDQ0194184.1 choline dehydrogenase-like flavoprotein [Paenibacillus wynnii]